MLFKERELVKIASDNPAHPKGYYTGFRDRMRPGDIEYIEKDIDAVQDEQAEPTKQKRKRK